MSPGISRRCREGRASCCSDCVGPGTFSPWCRMKNKLQRELSGHCQKFLVAPALRRIRCHHLCWDNSRWSLWMHSIYQNNIMNNFRLLVLGMLGIILSIGLYSWYSGIIVNPIVSKSKLKKHIWKLYRDHSYCCLKLLLCENWSSITPCHFCIFWHVFYWFYLWGVDSDTNRMLNLEHLPLVARLCCCQRNTGTACYDCTVGCCMTRLGWKC